MTYFSYIKLDVILCRGGRTYIKINNWTMISYQFYNDSIIQRSWEYKKRDALCRLKISTYFKLNFITYNFIITLCIHYKNKCYLIILKLLTSLKYWPHQLLKNSKIGITIKQNETRNIYGDLLLRHFCEQGNRREECSNCTNVI